MIKPSVNLQELRRRIYRKAKADLSGTDGVADLVVIRINMATYKSLFVSDVSATVIAAEDGQHVQNEPVSNRALERGKRSLGTPRAKIYVAVFRGFACQDNPACCRGTIQ